MNNKKCPVNAWDCPYFNLEDECELDYPEIECDDYCFYNGEEEE